jgi:chromosome segregation ATPase
MNPITKLTETFEKFMSGVDQRLEALEKTTREILVYQKTQKEFYQQQCNQLLAKMNELNEAKEKREPITSYQSTSTTTSSTSKSQSFREIEREKTKEQELADAQLAAQLQSQLDQESRSLTQTQNKEPEEKCPICNMKFPLAVLEKHCNEVHFNLETANRVTQDLTSTQPPPSQEQSWLTKWFGGKTETQQNQQPQQSRPQSVTRTTSSPALPYQQPYLLAPAYVQNSQGTNPVMFRPGQIPPGYSQVYYNPPGNPNLNTSSYAQ